MKGYTTIYHTLLILALVSITFGAIATKKSNNLSADQHQYKIVYNNSHYGYLKCAQSYSPKGNLFSINALAEANLFFKKISTENSTQSIFANGLLIESEALVKRNDKLLKNTTTVFTDGNYSVKKINKEQKIIDRAISFSVVLLYFKEPLGLTVIYSEAWGQFLPLVYQGNSSYSLKIPDGSESTFKYTNGQLKEVITNSIIGEIKFVSTKLNN
jgi:hypothetical protein